MIAIIDYDCCYFLQSIVNTGIGGYKMRKKFDYTNYLLIKMP